MMSFWMFGVFEIGMLMFGGGLPLGVPPLPEDPQLAQIAPQECLVYYNWNGMADADPNSKNRTVQLAAEEEIQTLFKRLDEELTKAFQREMRRPDEIAVGQHLPPLIRTLVTRPSAMYFSEFSPVGANGPTVEGALVVNVGDQADAVKKSAMVMDGLIRKEVGFNGEVRTLPQNLGSLRVLPALAEQAPQIAWGFHKKHFILTFGTKSPAHVYSALTSDTKEPAWLTQLKGRLPVDKRSTVGYINVKKIITTLGPMIGAGPEGLKVMSALGIDKVESIGSVTGLAGDGFASRTLIEMKGEPSGLFAVMRGKGLTGEELRPIPADASIALAGRINLADLYLELLLQMNNVDPNMGDEFTGEMVQFEREIGFKLLEELFMPLGDAWCVYNSPGEGGLVVTGLTLVVPIKDHKTLSATSKKLVDKIRQESGPAFNGRRRNRGVFVKEVKHGDHTINMMNPIGLDEDFFIAPSWCVTEKHLVVAAYPQMVKAYLSRKSTAGTLIDNPEAAAILKGKNAPNFVTYVDTKTLMKKFYPLLSPFATMAFGEIQREGIDLDISIMPTASSLLKHLGSDTGSIYRTDAGIVIDNRQTIPMGGGTSLMPMMLMTGVAMPMASHQRHRAIEAHRVQVEAVQRRDAVAEEAPAPRR